MATGRSCRWPSLTAAARWSSSACTPPLPIRPGRCRVPPRRFTCVHSSTSGGSLKNSPDSMACEIRTMSCGTTRPAPRFRCPTSLLPICPSGRPTASPDALSKVRGAFAQRRCQVGVRPSSTALPSRPGRKPQPSSTIRTTGVRGPCLFAILEGMQSSRALRALPVVLGLVAPLPPARKPGDPQTPGRGSGVGPPDTSSSPSPSAPVDPSRVESARRTVLYRSPEGQPAGTLAPSAPLRVLGRSGDWTRVELEGWVKSADLEIAPPGVLVGITAAELRTDPQRYAGQVLRWTLQFISTQQADELRPEIPNGATYMLARGPLPERGFVYVVVPEARRAQLETITPLATIQVTARVRTGRTRFLGNPVLDMISLGTLP